MRIICGWCNGFKGTKEPLEDDSITHTICPECAERELTKALEDIKDVAITMQDVIESLGRTDRPGALPPNEPTRLTKFSYDEP